MASSNKLLVKNLYCVEYPGNVQNVDRMIDTLGGINNISNTFSDSQRKLECRFRPEDRFCKGTVAERNTSTAFLLKVIVKRKKKPNKEDDKDKNMTCSYSVIGKIHQIFRFRSLSDFQYLPMDRNEDGKLVSIYDEIVPNQIVPLSWFYESSPLYLPPAIFSRADSIQSYLSSSKVTEESGGLIGRTRDRRSNYVKFVNHELKEIPETPNPNTLRYIKLKLVTEEQILRIKELFEERPVWTKNGLQCVTKYPEVQLKYLLALSAYHFTSGPYRITWVRFGYDPRKDRSSQKYQTVDYRLRSYVQSILKEQLPERYSRGRTKLLKFSEDNDKGIDQYDDLNYIFKPGIVPPQKQIFYQVCDIQIPEVQQKLNSFPNDTPYHTLRGWLSEEFLNYTRETIDKYVLEVVQRTNNGNVSSKNSNYSIDETIQKNSGDSSEEMEFDLSDQEDY